MKQERSSIELQLGSLLKIGRRTQDIVLHKLKHPGGMGRGGEVMLARIPMSPAGPTIAVGQEMKHHVNGNRTTPPFPEGLQMAVFGMGCFWGAERKFWRQKGVYSTQVGYAGGFTPNPSYEEVCTGKTGHTEVVRVVFDPAKVNYGKLLKVFWESHNPTQGTCVLLHLITDGGMRQGNDVGTTYRSAIYTYSEEQMSSALSSKDEYEKQKPFVLSSFSIVCSLPSHTSLPPTAPRPPRRHLLCTRTEQQALSPWQQGRPRVL
ncbi:hypothetical protein JZ751_005135 [Albula glossodonta]|uniref:peptide-methionine (S)-S-oxide reductase n=1 Tax=Albula glossodonta TaxID=121402 RepID=A0A8T2P7C1_9TELE|nr:hypothetical protein JZ751_005135 [Albula glossodonta]